ncbi:MAG TPA: PDZ domain-containing protein, partial [Planctomycetota bacterium]|nr:PDZ domain-containing protein [Planctomycetota bacterium]
MADKPSSRRGFWIAQAFVAGILAFIAFRFSRSLEHEVSEAGSRAGKKALPSASRGALPVVSLGKVPLRTEPEFLPEPPAASSGTGRRAPENSSYDPSEYRTWVSRDEPSYKVWDLDARELQWLRAHRRQILLSDLETRPEPEGGLRITGVRSGSFAAYRGLRIGDRLEEINGQSLDGPTDLVDLIEDPAQSGALGWRIQLEREGRALTLDYRAAPGAIT